MSSSYSSPSRHPHRQMEADSALLSLEGPYRDADIEGEGEAPFVAVALLVEEGQDVKLQLVTVGDQGTLPQQQLEDRSPSPSDMASFNSAEIEKILESELSDVDVDMEDESDEKEQGDPPLEVPDVRFEIPETDVGQSATGLPIPQVESLPVESRKSNEELKTLAQEAFEQYEKDRVDHCELFEKLNELYKGLKKEKRELLRILTAWTYKDLGLEPQDKGLLLAHQEQLLQKIVCGNRLMREIQAARAEADDQLPLHDIPAQTREGTSKRTGISRKRSFTMEPLPQWLTENRPPAFLRKLGAFQKQQELHPLRDMALKVEKKGNTPAAKFEVSWVPRTRRPAPDAQTKKTTPESSEPESNTATSPPASPPSPESQASSAVNKPQEDASESEEDEAVDILLDMQKMGFGVPAQDQNQPEQEELVSKPLTQPWIGIEIEKPVTTEAPASPRCTLQPDGATQTPVMLTPKDVVVPQSTPTPPLFQIQPQTAQMRSSTIAGGAAFGQSSVPRSNFGLGGLAPQLGSLGSSGTMTGGFAGVTGGFAAFAQQATPPSNTPQQSPSGFAQFASSPSSFMQNGSNQSGFGSSAPMSSLFSTKPAAGNDKLWEMRK